MLNSEHDSISGSIRQVEEKHDLLKYKVDGSCVWHYFRPAIDADMVFKNEPLINKNGIPLIRRVILALQGLPNLLFPHKAVHFVVTCSSDRSELEGSKYKNVLFDTLLLNLGSYFIVETANSHKFLFKSRDVLVKSDMTAEPLFLLAFLLSKLHTPVSIREIGEELSTIIRQEFGLKQYTPKLVSDWCMYFYWLKKIYGWLIKRVDPNVVFMGSGGASYVFAAAKELKIKVVEFQHGAINRHSPIYSWTQYAISYKNEMPVPGYIFLSSDYEKQELMTTEFWADNELRPVGNIRVDEYREKRGKLINKNKQGCRIVFTTGTNIKKSVEFISAFLQMARDKLELKLIIKTHPAYESDSDIYVEAFGGDDRVGIILGNELPSTFEVLASSDIHVSVCSYCHFDALALGVPTILIALPCHEIFLPLHRDGHVLLANTPEELFEIISHFDAYSVPSQVREMYFKSGAFNNIKSELRKILNDPLPQVH